MGTGLLKTESQKGRRHLRRSPPAARSSPGTAGDAVNARRWASRGAIWEAGCHLV